MAVRAEDAVILGVCASYAVNLLVKAGANREAAALGEAVIAALDAASVSPPLDLLWTVAQAQVVIGDLSAAQANLERALASIREAEACSEPVEPGIHGGIFLAHSRILVTQGRINEALPELETAAALVQGERDRAVVRGAIADILEARGDLDEALRIRREEELPVYERLGDVRSLLVGRTNLALLLVQRQREEDAEEIARLLTQAYQDAVRMGLPEAQQIEQIIHTLFGNRE